MPSRFCWFLLPCAALAANGPTPASSWTDAVRQGQASLHVRFRFEGVDQTGLRDAHAGTVGTRLGFATAPLHGFKAFLQVEDVTAVDDDAYSQAGLNPGGAGRAVVADPETTEVNQLWLGYTGSAVSLTAGRQQLVLDNARFIGNVGWRQNLQTFDAVTVRFTPVKAVAATYGYLDRIHRVFGDDHPQGEWNADAHVLHVSTTALPGVTLTGYAYLLEFDQAANSSATYGAFVSGSRPLSSDWRLSYRAEYAHQTDYGNQPADYATEYVLAEAGAGGPRFGLAAGYELLGSDRQVGFKTPLATLHAFNGWADLFLVTPGAGLRDRYLRVNAKLPAALELLAFYHWFDPDTGPGSFGTEFDVQLGRKFGPHVAGLVKYATFSSESSLPDVDKLWVQVELTF